MSKREIGARILFFFMFTVFTPGMIFAETTGILEEKNAWVINTETLKIIVDKDSGVINSLESIISNRKISGTGGIYLTDESDGKIKCEVTGLSKRKQDLFISKNAAGLNIEEVLSPFPGYITCIVRVKNNSPKIKLLNVIFSLPVQDRKKWEYWDGVSSKMLDSKLKFRDNDMNGKFPMSCIYDKNSGFALGIDGHQFFSSLESGSNSDMPFYYASQIVVDPNSREEVRFIVYDFKSTYGYLNALQIYYDIFPDLFRPAEGVNPKSYGLSGYVRAPSTRLYWEECRRFCVGWDWVYGPFQKTGLWYPEPDEWDTSLGNYGTFPPSPEAIYRQLEEYRSALRARYANARKGCIAAHYIIPHTCDLEIAKEKFPDSGVLNIMGDFLPAPIVKRVGEKNREMYAYGNSFGKRTLGDIEKIANDYGPGGFGFDDADGLLKNYAGKGVEVSPGRAFVDDILYALQGIAYSKCMEKVHSLKGKDGYRLGVISNGAMTYLTAFHSDAGFRENPYRGEDEDLKMRIRLFGKKPFGLWRGYLQQVDVKSMTPEQISEYLRKAEKSTTLFCLFSGVLPGVSHVKGYPAILRAVPAMLTMRRAGWEPVSAVLADNRIETGRFGKGTDTYLSLVNRTESGFEGEVVVENEYLGNNSYFFTAAFQNEDIEVLKDSQMTECTVFPKRTVLKVKIPSDSALVVKAVGGFSLEKGSVRTKTVTEYSSVERRIKVEAVFSEPHTAGLMLGSFEKARFDSVSVNDRKQNPDIGRARDVCVKGISWKDKNEILVSYKPVVTIVNPDQILSFPFTKKDKPDCTIVVGDRCSEESREAADRIGAYFEYYYSIAKDKPVIIPVKEARQVLEEFNENLILVALQGENDSVKRLISKGYKFADISRLEKGEGLIQVLSNAKNPKKILYIAGDNAGIMEAVFALSGILDRKYIYYDPQYLPGQNGDE